MRWINNLSEKGLINDLKIVNVKLSSFLKERLIIMAVTLIVWVGIYLIGYYQHFFNMSFLLYGSIGAMIIGFKISYFNLKIRVKRKTQQVYYDFPLWLSSLEVLVLSNNIPNTLKKSLVTCPPSIRDDLQQLIMAIENDPMDQRAYIHFLSQYHLPDINELMLDLYQFNYLDKALMVSEFAILHRRINAMNTSNRKHLHEQNLFFIGAINSIPLFLLSVYILLIANMLSGSLMGGYK